MKVNRKIYKFLVFCGLFLFLFSFRFVLATDSLGLNYTDQLGLESGAGVTDPRELIVNIVQYLLTFIGLIAVAMFMYGGWLWMTAGGSADRVEKAKKTLISATIGLVVIILSYAIVSYISNNLLDDLGATGCIDGQERVCGCGGTQTCEGTTWGACEGSDCSYDSSQTAFRVRSTSPDDEDTEVVRNINMRAFLSGAVDAGMTQAQLNENFIVEKIADVDPETLVSTAIVPVLVELEGINLLSGDRTLSALASSGCGDEADTQNCLLEWSRYRVSINDGMADIVSVDLRDLDCANGLCHFEFVTDDSVDTATPTVNIIPTQICQDDGTLETDANVVGAWARDDIGISEMRYYQDIGAGNVLVHNEPGSNERYQFYAHQYDSNTFPVGATAVFTVEADDMAGDTEADSFEAVVRAGHCCNGILDLGEEDIDCGGTECESCTMRDPLISFFNPEDGAVGNWITIGGRYFGTVAGEVYFSDGAGAWVGPAEFPEDVNANCTNDWTSRQVVVVVPTGAVSGPIRIVRYDGREDVSDNDYGSQLDDFVVNTVLRPGLCLANPAFGYFASTTVLQGTGFDLLPHNAFFGNTSTNIQTVSSAWTSSSVLAEVLNLSEGRTSVFVEAGGEKSNFIDFRVLVDNTSLPTIDYIDPASGPIGQYITIYGSDFGSYLSGMSKVEFDDGESVVLTDGLSFPAKCQGRWWNDEFIIVKVPEGINLDMAEVRVINRSNQSSDIENFEVVAGEPSPGICLLDPHNGLVGSVIDVYGDNMDDGSSGFVRYFNNIDQARADVIWANQVIKANVATGIQTGPLRVINDYGTSNSLNFTLGSCSDDSECFASEECCGAGSSWAGVCRDLGECGAGSAGTTGYGWSFTTGANEGTLTCGGNSSRSACDAAGTCPNSPGSCQTTTDLDLEIECSSDACNDSLLSCAGDCAYNSSTNFCVLTTDACESSIFGWADASCNKVGVQSLWQVSRVSVCPVGTYLDSNGWCTIGTLGAPELCDTCGNGTICINNTCVVPKQLCPDNSHCDAGQCVLDFETCDCCCEVGEDERDCCLGLICVEGGCGDDPAFGECSGCRVENNGVDTDLTALEQALSDQACNCDGHDGKYCAIANPADFNDLGACKDATPCDSDPYTDFCDASDALCGLGQFCGTDCYCQTGMSCDGDNIVSNGCSASDNCDPATEHCDLSDCFCKDGASCDGDLSTPTCDADDMSCDIDQVCNPTSCLCEAEPAIPGDPCDIDLSPGGVMCDMNRCGKGYECLSYDVVSQPCGNCCCEIPASEGDPDTCQEINSALFCNGDDNVGSNCYDAHPSVAPNFGICCGCASDEECGSLSTTGCGTDTCCRARPEIVSIFPADMPEGAGGEVCRNTAIQATFDGPMSITSFSGNVVVFGNYGIDQCPEGTTYLTGEPAKNSLFARVYYKTLGFFDKVLEPIMPERFASAFTVPESATNYCAVSGSVSGHQTADGGAEMSFELNSLLDGNRLYYVVVKGDKALDGKSGVKDINGIGMNASQAGQSPSGGINNTFNGITYTNAYIWSFRTLADLEVCEVSQVEIQPASYLFKTTENSLKENDGDINDRTFDTIEDSDKVFVARALDMNGNQVVSISGIYEFSWEWSIADVSIASSISVAGLADNYILVRADEDIVDGHTNVNVDAISGILPPSYSPFSISDSATVYVFLCDNPWPPIDASGNWQPWRDDNQGMNCIGGALGCHNTNYEIYYCRDAGEMGTYDDLPAINSDDTINRNESALECSFPGEPSTCSAIGDACGLNLAGICTKVLKESFFFREDVPDVSLVTLTGEASDDGKVLLTWGDVASVSSYKVYYGNSSGSYINEIAVSLIESHYPFAPYEINGLENRKTYYFAVTALYPSMAESILSNEIELTPTYDLAAYLPPDDIEATSTDSEVKLTWTAVSGVSSYRLYYGVVDNTAIPIEDRVYGSSQNIGIDNEIILSGLTNGKTYYFAVTSVEENGNESEYSDEVSATPNL